MVSGLERIVLDRLKGCRKFLSAIFRGRCAKRRRVKESLLQPRTSIMEGKKL